VTNSCESFAKKKYSNLLKGCKQGPHGGVMTARPRSR
jgi:hypothetical protein